MEKQATLEGNYAKETQNIVWNLESVENFFDEKQPDPLEMLLYC